MAMLGPCPFCRNDNLFLQGRRTFARTASFLPGHLTLYRNGVVLAGSFIVRPFLSRWVALSRPVLFAVLANRKGRLRLFSCVFLTLLISTMLCATSWASVWPVHRMYGVPSLFSICLGTLWSTMLGVLFRCRSNYCSIRPCLLVLLCT